LEEDLELIPILPELDLSVLSVENSPVVAAVRLSRDVGSVFTVPRMKRELIVTDLEQRAWGHFLYDVFEGFWNSMDGLFQEWESLYPATQQDYLKEAEENPLHSVQLIYFKTTGKYYTEAKTTIACPNYDIGKVIAKMLAHGHWPGLCCGKGKWAHFDVLIQTLPENDSLPSDHPNYIVPVFLRNEQIMEWAY
jgi:hypothetical protein